MDPDVALRLRKIEGQVRGIQRMIDDGRACPDLLTQLMAVRSAIDGVSISLLTNHMDSCLTGGQLSDETKEVLGDALRMFLRLKAVDATEVSERALVHSVRGKKQAHEQGGL